MKPFDLGFYVVPDPQKMREQLDILAAAGIKHIGTDGFCAWRDDAFTQGIAGTVLASGMNLHSFHAPFGLMYPRPEDLKRSLADNRRIIDVASSWGAKNIVWHVRWFRADDGDTHFADTKVMDAMGKDKIDALMAQVLPETCAYAARNGININLENLPLIRWGRDCADILAFIRAQGLENLGFIYDIGHAWCSGIDPSAPIMDAGNLLNDTHFHDNYGIRDYDLDKVATIKDVPLYDLHLPVGVGTINWPEVIRALHRIGYANPVIFEGPHMKGHPEANSPEQYRRCVNLTIDNWRAAEDIVAYLPSFAV